MKNLNNFLLILTISSALYFGLFHRMDSLPIQTYDEGRLAINAIEMMNSGDFIVTTFQGGPETWNTKPPLMIWIQVLFLKTIGINEIAIRLPSVLAGMGTLLMIFFYFAKKRKDTLTGILSFGILLTSMGFNKTNIIKAGDYNSLLIFWATLAFLSFFEWANSSEKPSKYSWVFFISISLGILTKSVMILFLGPAFLFWLISQKKIISIISSRQFWLGSLLVICTVGGYYLIREYYQNGYLEMVYMNELGGRYLETIEQHAKPFDFYLKQIVNFNFVHWIWLLPISLWIVFDKKSPYYQLIRYSWVHTIFFILIISIAKTKLENYDAIIYPFLSIIGGITLSSVFRSIAKNTDLSIAKKNFLITTISLLMFAYPFYHTIKLNYNSHPRLDIDAYHHFVKNNPDLNSYKIASDTYSTSLEFYLHKYANDPALDIQRISAADAKAGDEILICVEETKANIRKKFHTSSLRNLMYCDFMHLDSLRKK